MVQISMCIPAVHLLFASFYNTITIAFIYIIILNFWTDMLGQIVQTQIRLLLQNQHDQGLQFSTICYSICICLEHYCMISFLYSNFRVTTANDSSQNLGKLGNCRRRDKVCI